MSRAMTESVNVTVRRRATGATTGVGAGADADATAGAEAAAGADAGAVSSAEADAAAGADAAADADDDAAILSWSRVRLTAHASVDIAMTSPGLRRVYCFASDTMLRGYSLTLSSPVDGSRFSLIIRADSCG